jgi:hypothetical protein
MSLDGVRTKLEYRAKAINATGVSTPSNSVAVVIRFIRRGHKEKIEL